MTKTNKSLAKRLKITKHGKILVRKPGINHFLAKKSRTRQLTGKLRVLAGFFDKKELARLLPLS